MIDAHLAIVLAALAVSRWTRLERDRQVDQESVKIARRDRRTEARAVRQVIAADLLTGDLRQAIDAISRPC